MLRAAVWLLLLPVLLLGPARGQDRVGETGPGALTLGFSTDAVGPMRFVAVHGRRSVVMGYPQDGLEIWGHPFQILSGYHVGFRQAGAAAEVDARLQLRRLDYDLDAVTRTYIGPDYLVRERIFVPLNRAAATIRYEVEGTRKLEIVVHFVPVMNLMWPGAVGGQYTRWNGGAPGFVITEPEHGVSAVVGSPEIVAHDDTVNSTVRAESGFSFALRPAVGSSGGPAKADVVVALNAANAKNPEAPVKEILASLPRMEAEARARDAGLESSALRIRTPDEAVNRDLAWAIEALDQAWVCNPLLGCGMVAGYGPSRDARRPQYAWFFGGDGLVATNALVSAGEYARAKEELEFIGKYQDRASGMIWHEMSQSAGMIDWSKYPYMFVHVDISFDYLATVARYVATSGDVAFARENWGAIDRAYQYCRSTIGSDHLPHIPEDKEASDEQHRPADDLGLSAGWMAAASGFAEVAGVTGHAKERDAALGEVPLTREAIRSHYWSAERNFWLDGHTHTGAPIFRHALGPTDLLLQDVFSAEQNEALLEQIASADFQTDWGSHGVAASAKDYDPYSYGSGSVSLLGTTAAATTLWRAHRPESAFALWDAVMQGNTLDSPGHLHEVLAGNFYQEQTESVPEQTWSSAGLIDTTSRGLAGLEIDGVHGGLRFAPQFPLEWDRVSVENVRLPHAVLGLTMTNDMRGVDLAIRNDGAATTMSFEPRIPLGARVVSAEFQGHAVEAKVESFPGDAHAKVVLEVPPGASGCHLRFEGGVWVSLPRRVLRVGDPSTGLKLVNLMWSGDVLSIEADVHAAGGASLLVRSGWKIVSPQGATVRPVRDGEYEVELGPGGAAAGYRRVRASLTFVRQ